MKTKMRRPTPEDVWSEFGKMVMKIAHAISEKYKRPYDELLSEGILRVFTKLPKWNPHRASLCTYVHQCATYGMLDYCIKPQREIPFSQFSENPHFASAGKKEANPWVREMGERETQPNWLQSFLSEVSEETRHLVKVIFEAPEELYEAIKITQPKTSLKKLRVYMIDVLDWTTEDVNRAFQEMAQCL